MRLASLLSSTTLCRLHPLKEPVVVTVHADLLINRLRLSIRTVDIKANAADMQVRLRELLDIAIHLRKEFEPADFRPQVHALDPPDSAIAPVAPLLSNQ